MGSEYNRNIDVVNVIDAFGLLEYSVAGKKYLAK